MTEKGQPLRVLLVEDVPQEAELVLRQLRASGFAPTATRADTIEEVRAALTGQPAFDLILSDFCLGTFNALDVLEVRRASAIDIPAIIVTGVAGEEEVVECLRAGATDYLLKDRLTRLGPAVQRALEERRLRGDARRFEQLVLHAQQLEVVGRLAGGVAHDFNNLLTIILGYADMLERQVESLPAARPMVTEIQAAGRTAASLTQKLLAFGGQQVQQPVPFNLNAVVGALEPVLRSVIAENVELVVSTDARLGDVRADPSQIEQVVLNLVLNASDAMPGGGRIVIETANVELDEAYCAAHAGAMPGSWVMLTVSDTGPGIDRPTLAHIFEPFFTTKPHATGLGLATVYGIVQQAGGGIWVTSEVGHGATFTVCLPRLDRARPAAEKVLPEARLAGRETVLLVEDTPAVRRIARESLRLHGYTVIEAPSAEEALEIASREPDGFQLLLTDLMLPGIDGAELARRLRAGRPNLRVVYVSGWAEERISGREALQPHGLLVQKPFTPARLVQAVRQVLDGG